MRAFEQWRVQCVVPWCARIDYTPASMAEAQSRAVAHWMRCHPRRLRASRLRASRRLRKAVAL